ncbi:metal ABC transporter substrate-binding protein [Halalkalibacter krulwichiae]|uniref:Metal ABC transporter substrate-binding lipoprotein n=1 Tax=Halalkalibacter krulwichiae TaxID=199441 RepID=A0A1X9M5D4_9BACI|nr:metal ABC transporter substrate-binding protein [Halalkalibacter krulwichiae]ARK28606.1 Metal ABC transporter substrate-binding lipoprotein precursor [Halalkalibacter krulwichiae]
MGKKKRSLFLMALFTAFVLAACGGEQASVSDDEGIKVVTSFSILGDLAENVVGERGQVEYLVPIGEEPHEYETIPSDFQKVSDADVFYVNGFGLEEWLERLVQNVGDVPIITVSDGITPLPISDQDGEDPHAWLDVANVITYVENIRDDLTERDPDGAEEYAANADSFIAELEELHTWIHTEVESIDESKRAIVISENAFKYFGEQYGFDTVGIWELNSHEEGTHSQIAAVVDTIKEREIPAVFVETTVDKRYMETVANDAGVAIAGEVYTDAVGLEGSGAETYIKMMEHNVRTFVDGLNQ